mgnify:CR=1 FL=1|tara:strand:+ start:51 stop:416 length:366 start_codon:yes stop_codon:yes gene_type:complete
MTSKFRAGEINIVCTDLPRSLRFYRDILGFEEVGEDEGAVRISCGTVHFLLLPVASERAVGTSYCQRAEISFDLRTDDLKAAAIHLQTREVVFEEPWVEGNDFFVIEDPDGLRIEIVADEG